MNGADRNIYEEEIRGIIAEIAELEEDEIQSDQSFSEDLGFDSMMALEIVAKLEKRYKIKIPEEEMVNLSNLNNTVSLVMNHFNSL